MKNKKKALAKKNLNGSYKPKSKTLKVKGYYSIIFILLLVFIDRVTKIWATSLKSPIDYGFVSLNYMTNTGAGFSILENTNALLAIVSIIVLAALIYFYRDVNKFSAVLIISGISGNLIDRVSLGSVIDFINLKFWPVFNIADSLIFIGVAYWIILIWKK